MKLYKFKSGSEDDINALLNDQLWVSTLKLMNDPMDIGFYINGKYSENSIISFQNTLNRSIVVVSFSNVIQNRRLWNYYSDGMKGLVLAYRSEDLIKSLIKFFGKDRKEIITGKVLYGTDKYDLTNEFNIFLTKRVIPLVSKNFKLLFCKDKSWEDEQEYRIAISIDKNNNKDGFLLENIRPYEVGVGYRIAYDKFEKIKEWCNEKKILLRKYIPDFNNKNSNSDFKAELIESENSGKVLSDKNDEQEQF